MSGWLHPGEVFVGEARGEAALSSPRLRGGVSPRPRRSRGPAGSPDPGERMSELGSAQQDRLGKARELFLLCDKEEKGFITKRDMQRLQGELPLSPEQLESVFESLDRDRNGFLTPLEFNMGLGEIVGVEETECERGQVRTENPDPDEEKFTQILAELGAEKFFKDQWELRALWCGLRRERPELLCVLEELLSHTVAHLQDALKERDSLEQALRRRECDHDQVVRSIYEEMESQIREERAKRQAQDSLRQNDRSHELQEKLKIKEQELESITTQQRELESRIRALNSEHCYTRGQNERLQRHNSDLQEQLDTSRAELEGTLQQLEQIQASTACEHRGRERDVLKVSKNMQKEKESLLRQLELLREMNKRLRDEKDSQQPQRRTSISRRPLQKQGSIIGNYLTEDKPMKRQLSVPGQGDHAFEEVMSEPDRKKHAANEGGDEADGQQEEARHRQGEAVQRSSVGQLVGTSLPQSLGSPQRVFKVVFLGNSGVGKTAFIHRYCSGHFPNHLNTTVGIDFQVRSVMLDSTPIALQLWDTAGQERFRSITQQYFRKADGILAMYDITKYFSFTAVREWLDSLKGRVSEGTVLLLIGNKADIAEGSEREVTAREGRRLAEEYQAVFYECSAKTGHNVEEPMTHLARLLAALQDRQCESALCLADSSNSSRTCCK
ncbi:EF-hand calcium-binding domain-containing protein 4A [Anguilla anguilla]|uniref:EF-hand calcium-binding domain-containing protein 4A n=1 Tax=Anguilla anguilla TaxID=7936 RepID=UPI0015AA3B87|nr:EF-hand calcium-binding domain-containing protein 4A [Anguilla anguilla]